MVDTVVATVCDDNDNAVVDAECREETGMHLECDDNTSDDAECEFKTAEVLEGFISNGCDGWRKEDCLYLLICSYGKPPTQCIQDWSTIGWISSGNRNH